LTHPEPSTTPETVAELLARAEALAGRTLADIAAYYGVSVPPDLRRAKGFVGSLVERALGADARSRALPDFTALGVELKTVPLDARGRPIESTFVCTIELKDIGRMEWEASRVRHKLARVLWVPVEGTRTIPVADRRVGTALLWTLAGEDEAALRNDWDELAGWIGRGEVEALTAHVGRYLQVRPKAANSRSRRRALDEDGAIYDELPRGFYLRTQFTARIIAKHYALPEGLVGGSGADPPPRNGYF
jgi:DNA mismatch repair protein MutH